MNNRTQQRFDRSIREAVAATQLAQDQKPRRDVSPPQMTDAEKRARRRPPRGRLYLDPATGATVWEPAPPRTRAQR